MKTIKHNDFELYLKEQTYATGGVALQLYTLDHEPYMTATVNPHPPTKLSKNEVAIKDYSENEGILDVLKDAGIISKPKRAFNSGWVVINICDYNSQTAKEFMPSND
jgi:hypothetical protein